MLTGHMHVQLNNIHCIYECHCKVIYHVSSLFYIITGKRVIKCWTIAIIILSFGEHVYRYKALKILILHNSLVPRPTRKRKAIRLRPQ